jgi:hypothetical protein
MKLPAYGNNFCQLQPPSVCLWDLCWAQCDGFPYWPGVIVALRQDDELACVAFYDSSADVAEAQWFSTQGSSIMAFADNYQRYVYISPCLMLI